MNTTSATETITIEGPTPYGVKANGRYYNFSKFLKDKTFETGRTYQVNIYTSDKGAKYINEVLGEVSSVLVDALQSSAAVSNTHAAGLNDAIHGIIKVPESVEPKSSYQDYDAKKSKRILVQGVLQAVIQAQGLLMSVNGNWEEQVERTTLRFVQFAEENLK
jgi:hypothetical protein